MKTLPMQDLVADIAEDGLLVRAVEMLRCAQSAQVVTVTSGPRGVAALLVDREGEQYFPIESAVETEARETARRGCGEATFFSTSRTTQRIYRGGLR